VNLLRGMVGDRIEWLRKQWMDGRWEDIHATY
jgi:hypothetical protein